MGNDNIIHTDNLLNSQQFKQLIALQDAIIPPGEVGELPGAGELDLVGYIENYSPDFMANLVSLLDGLSDDFSTLEAAERHPIVEHLSQTSTNTFNELVFHAFACYYQDDRVHKGIGMDEGPPFPRGNSIEAGDLSLLDPVLELNINYRKS